MAFIKCQYTNDYLLTNNVLYLIFDDIRNTPVRLSLHEPGLLSAFEDYLTHIPAKFCQDSFSKC